MSIFVTMKGFGFSGLFHERFQLRNKFNGETNVQENFCSTVSQFWKIVSEKERLRMLGEKRLWFLDSNEYFENDGKISEDWFDWYDRRYENLGVGK